VKGHGKRHFHFVLDSMTIGVTKRGNPETYWFLLDCGHFKSGPHGPHYAVSHFATQALVVEKDIIKKIRMHCNNCATGKPHDERTLRIWQKVGIRPAFDTSAESRIAELHKLDMPRCERTGAYVGSMPIVYCRNTRCERARECNRALSEYIKKKGFRVDE